MPFLSSPCFVSSITYFEIISVSRKVARREQRLVISLHPHFRVVNRFPRLLCHPCALSVSLFPFSLGSLHTFYKEAIDSVTPGSLQRGYPQARTLFHNHGGPSERGKEHGCSSFEHSELAMPASQQIAFLPS